MISPAIIQINLYIKRMIPPAKINMTTVSAGWILSALVSSTANAISRTIPQSLSSDIANLTLGD